MPRDKRWGWRCEWERRSLLMYEYHLSHGTWKRPKTHWSWQALHFGLFSSEPRGRGHYKVRCSRVFKCDGNNDQVPNLLPTDSFELWFPCFTCSFSCLKLSAIFDKTAGTVRHCCSPGDLRFHEDEDEDDDCRHHRQKYGPDRQLLLVAHRIHKPTPLAGVRRSQSVRYIQFLCETLKWSVLRQELNVEWDFGMILLSCLWFQCKTTCFVLNKVAPQCTCLWLENPPEP